METASASPFASSLLFDYVATYMYEDDTPPEERRAQALSLDRDFLRELMGVEELRELLDAGAIEQVEASLRPVPRNADELHDLLRRAGPLREGEYDAGFAETLLRERRAIRARLASGELAAVEDAGLVRDAFGVVPPAVPNVFLEPVPAALATVLRRRARTRSVHDGRGRGRFGLDAPVVETRSCALEAAETLVRGEIGRAARSASGAIGCPPPDPPRDARRLRREVEPAEQAAFGASCRRGTGSGAARPPRGARARCRVSRCRSRSGRATCSRDASRATVPADLDALCASGDLVWSGAGLDRVAVYFRDDAAALGAPSADVAAGRRTQFSAPPSAGRPSSGAICSPPRISARRPGRSGTSCGPAR